MRNELLSFVPPERPINPYHETKVLLPYHLQRVKELARIAEYLHMIGVLDTSDPIAVLDKLLSDPELQLRLPSPSMMECDLTDEGCNQNCIHCCFESGREKKIRMIDAAAFIAFAKQAYLNGTRAFELVGGGEPTAHKDVSQIITRLAGFRELVPGQVPHIGMVSNGVLLHRVFSNMEAGELDWVRVSLDAATPDIYHHLHGVKGKNHFDKVTENIRTATTLMNPQDVGIGYLVVPPYNHLRDEILRATELAAEIGVGHIAFRPFQSQVPMPQEMWQEAVEAIAEARAQFGEAVDVLGGTGGSWDFIMQPEQRPEEMCLIRPLVMVVQANGDLASCFLYRQNDARPPLGNIANGYEKAWASNPVHLLSWLGVDMQECPNVCKFYRGNKTINAIDLHEPATPTANQKHLEFI